MTDEQKETLGYLIEKLKGLVNETDLNEITLGCGDIKVSFVRVSPKSLGKASETVMKCESCAYWKVLNPRHIQNGQAVRSCAYGESLDHCREYKPAAAGVKQ